MKVFLDGRVSLHAGDCLEVMAAMPENSVDAVVCDPPYHLTSIVKRFGPEDAVAAQEGKTGVFKRSAAGFMGQKWDGGDIAFRPETWAAVLRVLKPGGYLLAFASTRGFGRMSVAIEAAGFVSHPLIARLFDLEPAIATFIDSLSGPQAAAFLRLIDDSEAGGMLAWIFGQGFPKATRIKAPGFDGFRYGGQALKPAIEPIYMGQKPFSEESGTANILRHGTGAVNIDGCRVHADDAQGGEYTVKRFKPGATLNKTGGNWRPDADGPTYVGELQPGRWPANVVHDDSPVVTSRFPSEAGAGGIASGPSLRGKTESVARSVFNGLPDGSSPAYHNDAGSAARFFYSAKADADDRIGSKHATVKPVDLMRYLVRLVTPPGGTVLDPFAGTGTTGEAAWREGLSAVLIEREEEFRVDIAERMRLCLSGEGERRREIARRKQADKAPDHGPLFGGADTPPLDGRVVYGAFARDAGGEP